MRELPEFVHFAQIARFCITSKPLKLWTISKTNKIRIDRLRCNEEKIEILVRQLPREYFVTIYYYVDPYVRRSAGFIQWIILLTSSWSVVQLICRLQYGG